MRRFRLVHIPSQPLLLRGVPMPDVPDVWDDVYLVQRHQRDQRLQQLVQAPPVSQGGALEQYPECPIAWGR